MLLGLSLVAALLAGVLAIWHWPRQAPDEMTAPSLPAECRAMVFEEQDYVLCRADQDADIMLAHADGAGRPYGTLEKLASERPFAFAMNAGMYHEDKSPVGLHVENGREFSPLNLSDSEGNFFMKPNGVFFVDQSGKAGVLETNAYAAARPAVRYATQSGPMLVIDGSIHPRFEPDGVSRHIRNGVGIDPQGRAVFAISRQPVSLGKFARLFRDGLGCRNALFFDGAISALHDGRHYVIGGAYPVGPIVYVIRRE